MEVFSGNISSPREPNCYLSKNYVQKITVMITFYNHFANQELFLLEVHVSCNLL